MTIAQGTGQQLLLWKDRYNSEKSRRLSSVSPEINRSNNTANNLLQQDGSAHDWYRFVLSFPPHLVRDYIQRFDLDQSTTILDPFCGTGTTLVEAKKLSIPSVGVEALPLSHLASSTKVDWSVDPDDLEGHAISIAKGALDVLEEQGISDLPDGQIIDQQQLRTLNTRSNKLLLKNSISPLPLHKALVLLEFIQRDSHSIFSKYEKVALASALVRTIGNLRFGPEVGIGHIQDDAPVIGPWLEGITKMANDLRELYSRASVPSYVHHGDARDIAKLLAPQSIDAVITSPPYPNEKDYTRTTRLESVLLGYMQDRTDLQLTKRSLIRSNTRGVYKGDDDDRWVADQERVQHLADAIESRRIELNKTSGFERLYHRVTKLYFGGMLRHLISLKAVLKPGAHLAYVVGDQASYLRVMIRTGQLLSEIAQTAGYQVKSIDLFRTRHATATNEQLREEVVVLQWNGK